jgi:hypothetical protein
VVRLFTALIKTRYQEQPAGWTQVPGVSILKTGNILFAPIVQAKSVAALDRET